MRGVTPHLEGKIVVDRVQSHLLKGLGQVEHPYKTELLVNAEPHAVQYHRRVGAPLLPKHATRYIITAIRGY